MSTTQWIILTLTVAAETFLVGFAFGEQSMIDRWRKGND